MVLLALNPRKTHIVRSSNVFSGCVSGLAHELFSRVRAFWEAACLAGRCVPDSTYSCLNSLRGSVAIIRLAAFSLGAGKVLSPPSRGEGCHALVVEEKRASQHKASNTAVSNLFHVVLTKYSQRVSMFSIFLLMYFLSWRLCCPLADASLFVFSELRR